MKCQYSAWAIKVKFKCGGKQFEFFPHSYCWKYGVPGGMFPLFRTRREAREARSKMTSYKKDARVVRVTVTIQVVETDAGGAIVL